MAISRYYMKGSGPRGPSEIQWEPSSEHPRACLVPRPPLDARNALKTTSHALCSHMAQPHLSSVT